MAAFPHATPGYIPSPLQSPYLTSPLAHINPAMMSLFPAVTSPTAAAAAAAVTEQQHQAAMVSTTVDSSAAARSVQMQAALLPTTAMSVPSQFQQHHPQHQLQQLQQQHNKSKTSDRVEVSSLRSNYHHFGILLRRKLQS